MKRNIILLVVISGMLMVSYSCKEEEVIATGISIKSSPAKVKYTEGETLDLTGLEVTLSSSDGTDEDIGVTAFPLSNIECSPDSGDVLSTSDTVVTITHSPSGEFCTQDITIRDWKTDYDGYTYKTVTIGNQTWMAENLRVTHFPDGTAIQLVTDSTEWDSYGTAGAYCYYDNETSSEYGVLYKYATAKKVCPIGWHLPSYAEWQELRKYVKEDGHPDDDGTALKATTGWSDNGNGTDVYGFSALPGGMRSAGGSFRHSGTMGLWWTSSTISLFVGNPAEIFYLQSDLSLIHI